MAIMVPILGQLSGSIGGNTFFPGRFGMTVRNRVVPVNPSTGPQTDVRALFTTFSQNWSIGLTDFDRDTWANYAAETPMPGKMGSTIFLTGHQQYVRSAMLLRLNGYPDDDTGPSVGGQAAEVSPTEDAAIALHDDASGMPATFRVDLDLLDGFAPDNDGQGLLIGVGNVVGQGVNFYKSPFINNVQVQGDSVAPPTVVFANFNISVPLGAASFIRFRRINTNGRGGPISIYRRIAVMVP